MLRELGQRVAGNRHPAGAGVAGRLGAGPAAGGRAGGRVDDRPRRRCRAGAGRARGPQAAQDAPPRRAVRDRPASGCCGLRSPCRSRISGSLPPSSARGSTGWRPSRSCRRRPDPTPARPARRSWTSWCATMGRLLGLSPNELTQLATASRFRDLGMIVVPDEIITKEGPLSDDEWAIIRRHPQRSAEMLGDSPLFANVRAIVRASHEHVDGSGYPLGLERRPDPARRPHPAGGRVLSGDAVRPRLPPQHRTTSRSRSCAATSACATTAAWWTRCSRRSTSCPACRRGAA